MRFYLDCNELSAAVASVIKALPLRSTMPVLEGIYINATSEGVRLLCTDLIMQKECFVPATVEENGVCAVPGKLFFEFIRRMPMAIVEINQEGNVLSIKSGKTLNQVQCIDFDDFPMMRFDGESEKVTLDKAKFKEMVNMTAFAAAPEHANVLLTGVCTEVEDNKISMVATDSYQLAYNVMHTDMVLPKLSTVIPGKTVAEIGKMLDDCNDRIDIYFTRTHIKIDLGHTALVSRLLEGNYLDYKRLIPTGHKTRVIIDRVEFTEAIERANLVSRGGNNCILMRFENNMLYISAQSVIGKLDDELDVQIVGDGISIAFNPKFFINILHNITDEKIALEMNLSINPCVVRPVSGEGYCFLIVPMRSYQPT